MMKVIRLVEPRNLASVFPAPDAGTGTVWLRSKSGTNKQEDRIQLHGGSATYPTCMAAHSISEFFKTK